MEAPVGEIKSGTFFSNILGRGVIFSGGGGASTGPYMNFELTILGRCDM